MKESRPYTIAALAVAIQLWLAHRYFGFLTGDDVEVLGRAFQTATGAWYGNWDIRNLLIPDVVVAPMVWLGTRLPLSMQHVIELAALPFIAAFAVTVVLVHRLALEWIGDRTSADVAAALFAFHWIPLGFGSTVYPRTIATLCIVAAALLASRSTMHVAIAGALMGVAFADRYSEIVFIIPLLFITRRRTALLAGAIGSIVVCCGLYDWVTWGVPFASLLKFARLTLVTREFSSHVKAQPLYWYLTNVARWCSPTLLPLLWYGRRSRAIWFVAIPLAALTLIAHKELRYLQAIIPFLAIAAAAGFALIPRRIAVALVAISMIVGLAGLNTLRRKSQPAVMAAQAIATIPGVHRIALSQLWAFGDRFYLGPSAQIEDIGTPPVLDRPLDHFDALALYESDLSGSDIARIRRSGLRLRWRFDDGPARAVLVFDRSPLKRMLSP